MTAHQIFDRMVLCLIIITFTLMGIMVGIEIERRALKKVLESEVPIVYPHDATIAGGYLS